ncbi:MAG: hypothetical protein WDN69_18630 [Aliidongia sp.]
MASLTWRNSLGAFAALAVLALAGCGGSSDSVKLPEARMPTLPPAPDRHTQARSGGAGDPALRCRAGRWRPHAAVGTTMRCRACENSSRRSARPFENLHMLSADPKRFIEDFYLRPEIPLGPLGRAAFGGRAHPQDRRRHGPGLAGAGIAPDTGAERPERLDLPRLSGQHAGRQRN